MREINYQDSFNGYEKENNLINDETNLNQEEEDDLEQYAIDGKVNRFKIRMMKQINYLDFHYIQSTILKIFLGLIILTFPLISIVIFNSVNFEDKNKYFFFPYFISVCAILGSLLVLIVIKLGEGCQIYGIFIYTWERKNLLKILNSIIIGLFLIWLLFLSEKFMADFPLMKEKVTQTGSNEGTSKLFYEGSYSLRILFILLLWDLDIDNNGKYIHSTLGFFEYDDEKLLEEFHSSLSTLLIPIVSMCIYFIIKIILIKTKREFIYLVFYTTVIFQCCFFIFHPINNNKTIPYYETEKVEYFHHTGCKYIELISYIIIIGILVYLSFIKNISNLLRKKFYPFKTRDKKKFIDIVAIVSFGLTILGYCVIIILFFTLTFAQIDEKLSIYTYKKYWFFIYFSLIILSIGYSFTYGNYCFNLVFYPTSYEISPYLLKNEFYTKCSDRAIENNGPNNFSRYHSAKVVNSILPKIKRPKELIDINN